MNAFSKNYPSLPTNFDWKNPDYLSVFKMRAERLRRMREDPAMVPDLKAFYREDHAQFIHDWGVTFDPRNASGDVPSLIPFLLFPRQVEAVWWFEELVRERKDGLAEKSRDMGFSWLACGWAASKCMLCDGVVIGFGSRKEELVDQKDGPKSLFYKIRQFVKYIPREFRGTWDESKHAPHMRVIFPDRGSYITGEAGEQIGRGDRTLVYLIDEAAYLAQPLKADAALSQTTNCRIDISSVNGWGNPFAEKRHKWPSDQVFVCDWRDDPRKDQEWYDKQVVRLDPIVVAQEIDRNYAASSSGVVIPMAWIEATIDAHKKLGLDVVGARWGALDVADEGADNNAMAAGQGVLLDQLEEWSGKGLDLSITTRRANHLALEWELESWVYDADGLGAGVRAALNELGEKVNGRVEPFRGSGEVERKEEVRFSRPNEDLYVNRKAQGWWELRWRFYITYRALSHGGAFKPEEIVSISSSLPLLAKLKSELSRPTYDFNSSGQILIDKQPDGVRSPNLADAVMMRYATVPLRGISNDALDKINQAFGRRPAGR